MRIARFEIIGNIKYGLIQGEEVCGFQERPFSDFMKPGDAVPLDGSKYRIDEVKLLPPCKPHKYIGIGLN